MKWSDGWKSEGAVIQGRMKGQAEAGVVHWVLGKVTRGVLAKQGWGTTKKASQITGMHT